jgi:hypothetical protein
MVCPMGSRRRSSTSGSRRQPRAAAPARRERSHGDDPTHLDGFVSISLGTALFPAHTEHPASRHRKWPSLPLSWQPARSQYTPRLGRGTWRAKNARFDGLRLTHRDSYPSPSSWSHRHLLPPEGLARRAETIMRWSVRTRRSRSVTLTGARPSPGRGSGRW